MDKARVTNVKGTRFNLDQITEKVLPPVIPPKHHHLLITTERRVHLWHAEKTSIIFSSPSGGIAAAKEAENGSGLFAVGNGHVVILRTRKRIRSKCNLSPNEGPIALLSFANDCKEIFFSTSLQTSLRRYSILKDCLLEFSCTHPSQPAAIAVSANSTYLVSASPSPPITYLQDLRVPGSKILVKPRASSAPVTVISFHPQRDEIFLLGYADGTLSLHTASRIVLMRSAQSDGNLGHLKRLHRVTSSRYKRYESKKQRRAVSSDESVRVGDKSIGITAATFVAGYRLRVVSVAGDGKCRVIDFEHGACVLRTWHAQAACTSLAVFSPRTHRFRNVASDKLAFDTVTNENDSSYMIAVGRQDGCLLIYDALGLLRDHILIDRGRGRIVDLAWIPEPDEDISTPEQSPDQLNDKSAIKAHWSYDGKLPAEPSTPVAERNEIDSASPGTRLIDSLRSKRVRPLGTRSASHPPENIATDNVSTETTVLNCNDGQNTRIMSADFDATESEWTARSSGSLRKGKNRVMLCEDSISRARPDLLRETEHEPIIWSEQLSHRGDKPGNVGCPSPYPTSAEGASATGNRMPCSWLSSSSPESKGANSTSQTNAIVKRTNADEALFRRDGYPRTPSSSNQDHTCEKADKVPTVESALTPRMDTLDPELKGEQIYPTRTIVSATGSPANQVMSHRTQRDLKIRPPTKSHQKLLRTKPLWQLQGAILNASTAENRENQENFGDPQWPPLPSVDLGILSSSSGCDSHGCDCSTVIKEEMALVRAEISTLRKSLWVFGCQIELGAWGSALASPSGHDGEPSGKLSTPCKNEKSMTT